MSEKDTINFSLSKIESCGPYKLLTLKTTGPYAQKPGQHCFVHYNVFSKTVSRPYSIASAPRQDGVIELCITSSEDSEIDQALTALAPGDTLAISPAGGRFAIPHHENMAVFVAGGSGIAPLRSMILWRLHQSLARTILIYGCKNPEQFPYLKDFRDLAARFENFSYHCLVDENADNKNYLRGPVTAILNQMIAQDAQYFLCGPPPMMATSKSILKAAGVDDAVIYTDKY